MGQGSHELHIERRGDRDFVIVDDIEYPVVNPRRFDLDPWGALAEGFVAGLKRSAARYGLVDNDEKMAGEFVLQTRFTTLASFGMGDYCKIGGHIRDNISRTFEIALPRVELERIMEALRARGDYKEGLLGPKNSIFLYGRRRNVPHLIFRQNYFVPDGWLVVGNRDDMAVLIEQGLKSLLAGGRLALQVQGWANRLKGF
ncbi:MAG TPA: hypothetical protein VK403_06210 [Allosphingosinicella sp.]|nr:hypothetical protein [Allosphingosinicella sp.]